MGGNLLKQMICPFRKPDSAFVSIVYKHYWLFGLFVHRDRNTPDVPSVAQDIQWHHGDKCVFSTVQPAIGITPFTSDFGSGPVRGGEPKCLCRKGEGGGDPDPPPQEGYPHG